MCDLACSPGAEWMASEHGTLSPRTERCGRRIFKAILFLLFESSTKRKRKLKFIVGQSISWIVVESCIDTAQYMKQEPAKY